MKFLKATSIRVRKGEAVQCPIAINVDHILFAAPLDEVEHSEALGRGSRSKVRVSEMTGTLYLTMPYEDLLKAMEGEPPPTAPPEQRAVVAVTLYCPAALCPVVRFCQGPKTIISRGFTFTPAQVDIQWLKATRTLRLYFDRHETQRETIDGARELLKFPEVGIVTETLGGNDWNKVFQSERDIHPTSRVQIMIGFWEDRPTNS